MTHHPNAVRTATAALLVFTFGSAAHAQTAVYPPTPAPQQKQAAPAPSVPVPDSVVEQAKEHAEGNFTEMDRVAAGGQVQEAWDRAGPTGGVFKYDLCRDCSYKIRLREQMVSVIELPLGEKIAKVDVGDGKGFQVKPRDDRHIAVKPNGFGIDTSMIVYGKSGQIYPIYLRAESFNSVNVPDLIIKIEGSVTIADEDMAVAVPDASGSSKTSAAPSMLKDLKEPAVASNGSAGSGDFVETAPFNPDRLRGWGKYELWGDDELRPETVFRDDEFTYIRFGSKWKDLELPTAYVVVDGIDELVNTRVQGTTFIVESTQKLISLKSGKHFLCIRYEGDV